MKLINPKPFLLMVLTLLTTSSVFAFTFPPPPEPVCEAPKIKFANVCVPTTFRATLKYVRTGTYLNSNSTLNSVSNLASTASEHVLQVHSNGSITIWNPTQTRHWISYGWYPIIVDKVESYWQNHGPPQDAWRVEPVDTTSTETAKKYIFKFSNCANNNCWGYLGSYNNDLLYSVPSGWNYSKDYYTWEVTPVSGQ